MLPYLPNSLGGEQTLSGAVASTSLGGHRSLHGSRIRPRPSIMTARDTMRVTPFISTALHHLPLAGSALDGRWPHLRQPPTILTIITYGVWSVMTSATEIPFVFPTMPPAKTSELSLSIRDSSLPA